ncbi:hypothetical protein [Halalkalirubrum salinum]|uniref:hypothetical protein n=1 Tax=Halalkalirubrum salinum TaxID=2563889 RepID=UPI0010FBB5C6|nr:hypothetical protein [Halalkalirubrum salinum]
MDDTPETTETIELDYAERVRIGATRGEFNTEIGRPREYPDSADVTVTTEMGDRVVITVDATAGDHATGHADIELSTADATALVTAIEAAVDQLE